MAFALLALVGLSALGGCIVVPDDGYYDHHHHHWDHRDWR
jgi:hypothetical protein